MSSVASKDQNFQIFLNLPREMRMHIIDRMEADDRCRFSASSRSCGKEARSSKNYLYELELDIAKHHCYMFVRHSNNNVQKRRQGYKFNFKKTRTKKYLICQNLVGKHLWKIEIDWSTDLNLFAIEHFKKVLDFYQNIIKSLIIDVACQSVHFNKIDFDIKKMNNLERFSIFGVDVSHFLPKLPKILRSLEVQGTHNNVTVQSLLHTDNVVYNKIAQTQYALYMPYLNLTVDEMLQLNAPFVDINIGELTETDIYSFINMWKTGKKEKKISRYTWHFRNVRNQVSDFDITKLKRMFGIPQNNLYSEEHSMVIAKFVENTKDGCLWFDKLGNRLMFSVQILKTH